MQLLQRLITGHAHESGMSLVYVLIAAFVPATSSDLLGTLLQGQSQQ